ncbi:GNAT family N-acetyltransferase [Streptomyces iconiensis]|uniref:GNAT family N-acetyltransferase n=1 Tax=Streptomyces iconiensis TaxID=1384038 RepID=UPI003D2F85E4
MAAVFPGLTPDPDAAVLRSPRPGDLGWMVERHGAVYAREFGWDARFEAHCARVVAAFADDHHPLLERVWIAELEGERAGCAMCVRDGSAPSTARLRLLLVEPYARGRGLGRRLLAECVGFARGVGYRALVLRGQNVLVAARGLCLDAGFVQTAETHHRSYGRDLVGQDWHLVL